MSGGDRRGGPNGGARPGARDVRPYPPSDTKEVGHEEVRGPDVTRALEGVGGTLLGVDPGL